MKTGKNIIYIIRNTEDLCPKDLYNDTISNLATDHIWEPIFDFITIPILVIINEQTAYY